MLPKGYRIRKSKEFDLIRTEGVKYKSKNFMLVVRKISPKELDLAAEKEQTYPRFGFIVSKKIGGAVVRNKVKRWLREAVRLELHSIPKNIEATLIAFKDADKSSFNELRDELKKILENIKRDS
ncbi:ribonuclease P protein component [Candidatus Dojkabacteria bacterium]|nr:ribonuclease P protein component [Candidatus Dojkabacteria bacterium]